MIIASVNELSFGDCIWLDFGRVSDFAFQVSKKDNLVLIKNSKDQLIGLNLYGWSERLGVKQKQGFIKITSEQIDEICQELPEYSDDLKAELCDPYFVVGEIKEIENHPRLQNLKIIKVDLGNNKSVQLISGSVNLKVGLKTVVARQGTIMPDGRKILTTRMGGIDSPGALCNRADLKLDFPNIPGAVDLTDSDIQVGSEFASVKYIEGEK